MTKYRATSLFAAALLLTTGCGAPSLAQAQSAPGTILELNYPGSDTACQFITDGGLSISGDNAGTIIASGHFGTGCPTGDTPPVNPPVDPPVDPPSTTCVAPAGLTRQLTGTIQSSSGWPVRSNVDYTTWGATLGTNLTGTLSYTWPGIGQNAPKFIINRGQYAALKFTVPTGFPLFIYPFGPYGMFSTNDSLTTAGVNWSLSISEDCGDFMAPAPTAPDAACYTNFTTGEISFLWVVTSATGFVPGRCNLQQGKTYFLNIVAAPLNNPTQSNCAGTSCKVNLSNNGNLTGYYDPIP